MNKEQTNDYRGWLWTFVGVILVASVIAMIRLAQTNTPTAPVQTVKILSSVTKDDWARGNLTASTTIIEYGDFQCPGCASYFPIVKEIEKQYGSKFRFIFRHFPLQQHPNARLAAQASEAAGKQGKFWEMYEMLYSKQNEWAEKPNKDAAVIFTSYAEKLGLKSDQFKTDLYDSASIDKIEKSFDQGVGFGVDGTPTFFINDTRVPPMRTFAEFKTYIINAVASSTTN